MAQNTRCIGGVLRAPPLAMASDTKAPESADVTKKMITMPIPIAQRKGVPGRYSKNL